MTKKTIKQYFEEFYPQYLKLKAQYKNKDVFDAVFDLFITEKEVKQAVKIIENQFKKMIKEKEALCL